MRPEAARQSKARRNPKRREANERSGNERSDRAAGEQEVAAAQGCPARRRGSVGALAAPAVASAAEQTGQYTGNGLTNVQIATGLTQILALWIVLVPETAPA